MAPHSSTLAWKIPWMEVLVGCSPWGHKELDTTEGLSTQHWGEKEIQKGEDTRICNDSVGKESTYNAGDENLIRWLGRSLGEGNGNPLQCSCLENPRDRGAWWAAVYGVAQSWT